MARVGAEPVDRAGTRGGDPVAVGREGATDHTCVLGARCPGDLEGALREIGQVRSAGGLLAVEGCLSNTFV